MKVSTVGKSFSEVDRAYIAGFLDGDGAIMATIERHSEKKFGFRIRITVKITQYYFKDIRWLKSITGIGRFRSNRRTYEWIVQDQNAVRWLLEILAPYSRCKKKQIIKALEILQLDLSNRIHFSIAARLADTLSALNVRSKNRRKNFATMIEKNDSRND